MMQTTRTAHTITTIMHKAWARALLLALLTTALAACGLQPHPLDHTQPEPAQWLEGNVGEWPGADWWSGFGSPELETLLHSAAAANPDLRAAAARLLQAEAQARIAGAPLLPSVDLSASAARQGRFGDDAGNSYGLSAGASYELDLWGRVRAGREAALAGLDASRHDRDTVALTLSSSVANTWLQVLALRERLAIAELNLANAERVLAVVEARVRNGVAPRLELAQQQATVARQRAVLPPLQQQQREALSSLALLLGRNPGEVAVHTPGLVDLQPPAVNTGLPSELLARRPDIRRSEAQLVAAEANLVAARAALYPSLRLSAASGVQGSSASGLFDDNPTYSLAAGLVQPIFEGGRLRAQRDLVDARRLELLQTTAPQC